MSDRPTPSEQSSGIQRRSVFLDAASEAGMVNDLARIRWWYQGAVIPFESASPEVQERYREKARRFLRADSGDPAFASGSSLMSQNSTRQYILEALEPLADKWDQLHPPEWWEDATGEHPGTWEATSPKGVVEAFHRAWPKRHPGVKPYREFRVTPASARRHFRVEEIDPDESRFPG